MRTEDIKNLSFEEVRNKYRQYMMNIGLSNNTVNTAYSDSFYIWKKGSGELFWQVVLSENFEDDAKRTIIEFLEKYSKVDPYKNASSYVSHLRRFREFVSVLQTNEKIETENTVIDNPSVKTKKVKDYEETIIIERMYAENEVHRSIAEISKNIHEKMKESSGKANITQLENALNEEVHKLFS